MTTLINIFCLIGIIGIVVFTTALIYAIYSTRPYKLSKKREAELLAQLRK